MTWPSLELAERQVARYEAAVASTPPESPDGRFLARQLDWWQRKLAELTADE